MTEKVGNRTYNYLLGFQIEEFNCCKLPFYRDVINLFMHKHLTLKLTIRLSSAETINELDALWNKIGLPTALKRNSIRKLEKFYEEYKEIKKQKFINNKSNNQMKKVENFSVQLDKLFDITDNSEVKSVSSDLQLFLEECRQNSCNKCLPLISKLDGKFVIFHDQSDLHDKQEEIRDENGNIEFSKYTIFS